MATLDVVFSAMSAPGALGAPVNVPWGGGATFLRLTVTNTSDTLEASAGADWVAPANGFVCVDPDADVYVRFYASGESATAAPGAGWPVRADAPRWFAVRAGERISAVLK